MNWQLVISYLIFAECTAMVALTFMFFDTPPEFAKIGNEQKPKSFVDGLILVLKYLLLAPIVAPYLIYKQQKAFEWAKSEMAKRERESDRFRAFTQSALEQRDRK